MKTLPSSAALRRLPFGLADLAVILGTLTLLAAIVIVSVDHYLFSINHEHQLFSQELF